METLEIEEVLNFVKKLGISFRHPHSNFYKSGNEKCQSLKAYGICDYDNEDFYHKPFPSFSCHIPGCDRTFETVIQYEAHYNSCHSFTCKECHKNLPNFHLLDLHISETHDFFFMEQAKRKPMFKCFLEECRECFKNPRERRDHCIKIHQFPSDFRFDSTRKKASHQKKEKRKSSNSEKMDTAQSNEETSEMEVTEISKNGKSQNKKSGEFKGLSFGYHPQRNKKPVFQSFSKDLLNNLPES